MYIYIYSDILSDILSGIVSGIHSGILLGMFGSRRDPASRDPHLVWKRSKRNVNKP